MKIGKAISKPFSISGNFWILNQERFINIYKVHPLFLVRRQSEKSGQNMAHEPEKNKRAREVGES